MHIYSENQFLAMGPFYSSSTIREQASILDVHLFNMVLVLRSLNWQNIEFKEGSEKFDKLSILSILTSINFDSDNVCREIGEKLGAQSITDFTNLVLNINDKYQSLLYNGNFDPNIACEFADYIAKKSHAAHMRIGISAITWIVHNIIIEESKVHIILVKLYYDLENRLEVYKQNCKNYILYLLNETVNKLIAHLDTYSKQELGKPFDHSIDNPYIVNLTSKIDGFLSHVFFSDNFEARFKRHQRTIANASLVKTTLKNIVSSSEMPVRLVRSSSQSLDDASNYTYGICYGASKKWAQTSVKSSTSYLDDNFNYPNYTDDFVKFGALNEVKMLDGDYLRHQDNQSSPSQSLRGSDYIAYNLERYYQELKEHKKEIRSFADAFSEIDSYLNLRNANIDNPAAILICYTSTANDAHAIAIKCYGDVVELYDPNTGLLQTNRENLGRFLSKFLEEVYKGWQIISFKLEAIERRPSIMKAFSEHAAVATGSPILIAQSMIARKRKDVRNLEEVCSFYVSRLRSFPNVGCLLEGLELYNNIKNPCITAKAVGLSILNNLIKVKSVCADFTVYEYFYSLEKLLVNPQTNVIDIRNIPIYVFNGIYIGLFEILHNNSIHIQEHLKNMLASVDYIWLASFNVHADKKFYSASFTEHHKYFDTLELDAQAVIDLDATFRWFVGLYQNSFDLFKSFIHTIRPNNSVFQDRASIIIARMIENSYNFKFLDPLWAVEEQFDIRNKYTHQHEYLARARSDSLEIFQEENTFNTLSL